MKLIPAPDDFKRHSRQTGWRGRIRLMQPPEGDWPNELVGPTFAGEHAAKIMAPECLARKCHTVRHGTPAHNTPQSALLLMDRPRPTPVSGPSATRAPAPRHAVALALALLGACLSPAPAGRAADLFQPGAPRRHDPAVVRAPYRGWTDALTLENGLVEAVVVPEVGRIMQFRFVTEEGVTWEEPTLAGRKPDMELEILGPLTGLRSGQQVEQTLRYHLLRRDPATLEGEARKILGRTRGSP